MLPEEENNKKTLTIARRTRKNLDFMYAQKAQGADVEEFTHLLNSMLGMVICLREEYFKGEHVSWQHVQNHNLQKSSIRSKCPSEESPKLKPHNSFSQLTAKVRHAFAHNCFDLQRDKTNKITGIVVWNIPTGQLNNPENRIWEAEISEQQLRELAYLFVNYVEKVFGQLYP